VTIERKSKPKIVIYSESPITYYGGGERLMVEIGNYLTELGYSVELCSDENTKLERRISEKEVNESVNFTITFLKFEKKRKNSYIYQPLPPLSELISSEKISIIFLRRIPTKEYLENCLKSNAKIIFALHGIALENIRVTSPKIILHQILTRYQLTTISRYTRGKLIVQSLTQGVSDYLVKRGADINNIRVIANGIQSERFIAGRNDKNFEIIFIGRIENLQKGVKRLKKICNLLRKMAPEINVQIIGTGRDNRILKNLPRNATFFKNVNDSKKLEMLKNANLCLITSNIEPFSIVAVESLASGLPIVSTPSSGPVEIISKEIAFGVYPSFSAKKLSLSIIKFYNNWKIDKEQYFVMKERISERGKELFDIRKMKLSYRYLVEDAINKP
jgi:glycosyltransferase involved in cell wall biosynthesis